MLLEADLKGNFVGSSYGWASTRDWARFGLLYLNRGKWGDAQIFDPSWADYVASPTAHSEEGYGAHFWLNAGGKYPDAPRDMYMANGFEGQHVFIIPSKKLVIVRTGLAEDPDFELNAFLKEVLAAIPSGHFPRGKSLSGLPTTLKPLTTEFSHFTTISSRSPPTALSLHRNQKQSITSLFFHFHIVFS